MTQSLKWPLVGGLVLAMVAALLLQPVLPARGGTLSEPYAAPEFTHDRPDEWINSRPLELSDLAGRVVLIDFWTFDCWNCYRSFPWLTAMEDRLPAGAFQVIGVHSPEFDHEKNRASVAAKAREFMLHHPVMIDNDFSYWRAMNNRFWPAFYILDKKGRVRAAFFGETHEGDPQAKRIEQTIRQLIDEPA